MLSIRRMTRLDADFAISMAAAEGWNPGLNDADCFYNTDPNGFFIGELDGEPVGCISAVAYDDKFGFIGLYVVRPEYRGKGYGIRLWKAALEYLGDRNIGLDGVLAQQENYKKSGFRLAYRNIRYEGLAGSGKYDHIVALESLPFEDVVRYDATIFPAMRPEFLRRWISQSGCAALGYVENGRLAGYGVIRQCLNGHKIGPVFADHDSAAENLCHALSNTVVGQAIFLDVPEVNPAGVALAKRLDMHPVFETARMYTKGADLSQVCRVYGVTSFELG
ncbi:GNAT family N-acetyltransferase [Methanocella sp. MCL-LM]|uniref:GNAT family N-acetyltransferase n=1 Tax=Methanocella sp. MCL-LM TaxID=3412035 RepID=UPI003C76524C